MSKPPVASSAARDALRAFAPKFIELTDDVLFGDVWERPGLSKRDRSLITVRRPGRAQSHRAAGRPLRPRAQQRRQEGGDRRDDHPSGVLRRLAGFHVGGQRRQEGFRGRIQVRLCYFDDFKLGVLKGDTRGRCHRRGEGHPAYRPGRSDERADRALGQLQGRGSRRRPPRGKGVPLSSVRIRPPLPKPAQHRLHGGQLHGRRHAQRAGADQRLPQDRRARSSATATRWCCPTSPATIFEGEAELAVVIGKTRRHVNAADAMNYVFGYINFIDGSARGLPPPGNVFFQMKSRDTFAPIGPCIVTADEIKDPQKLQIRLWNNGMLMQNFNTDDMAHKIPRCIEWLIVDPHAASPATSSPPAPTIAGSTRSWTATRSSSRSRGLGTLALQRQGRAQAHLGAQHPPRSTRRAARKARTRRRPAGKYAAK